MQRFDAIFLFDETIGSTVGADEGRGLEGKGLGDWNEMVDECLG